LNKKRAEILFAYGTQELWRSKDCNELCNKISDFSEKLTNSAAATQDTRYEAEVLGFKGLAAGMLGDYPTAFQYLERGWELRRSHEYKPGQVRSPEADAASLLLLSEAASSAGQTEKAAEYAQQGVDIVRPLPSSVDKATALTTLARILYVEGNYEAAEGMVRDGLRTWSEVQSQYPPGSTAHAEMSGLFFDSQLLLQAIALARNDTQGALRIAEESRSGASSGTAGQGAFDPASVARKWNTVIILAKHI
jgi:tetratricopeptide (TPR) repeat protein